MPRYALGRTPAECVVEVPVKCPLFDDRGRCLDPCPTTSDLQAVEVPLHKYTGAGLSGVLWLELHMS